MAESDNKKEEDLSRLLTDAIEVQLAALRAGIGFWSEWIERTTEFVQSATARMNLPPLVLPLYRIPRPETAAKKREASKARSSRTKPKRRRLSAGKGRQ